MNSRRYSLSLQVGIQMCLRADAQLSDLTHGDAFPASAEKALYSCARKKKQLPNLLLSVLALQLLVTLHPSARSKVWLTKVPYFE